MKILAGTISAILVGNNQYEHDQFLFYPQASASEHDVWTLFDPAKIPNWLSAQLAGSRGKIVFSCAKHFWPERRTGIEPAYQQENRQGRAQEDWRRRRDSNPR